MARLGRRRLADIGAHEAGNVFSDGRERRPRSRMLLDQLLDAADKRVAVECQRRIMAECPKPCRVARIAAQHPMCKPCRDRVFHVRIETAFIEQELAELCGLAAVIGDHSDGCRPMAHRPNHIPSNTELGNRVVGKEHRSFVSLAFLFRHSIERLLEPPIAQREGLMARKLQSIIFFVEATAWHIFNLDGASS